MKVPPYFFSIIRLVNSPNKCAILNPNDSTPPPQQLQAFSPKNYKKFCKGTVDTHSFVSIITQQLGRKVCLRPEKQAAFSFRQQHHHFFSLIFTYGTSGVGVFTFTHRRYFAALCIFCALGMQSSRFCKVIINKAFYRKSRPAVWFDSG